MTVQLYYMSIMPIFIPLLGKGVFPHKESRYEHGDQSKTQDNIRQQLILNKTISNLGSIIHKFLYQTLNKLILYMTKHEIHPDLLRARLDAHGTSVSERITVISLRTTFIQFSHLSADQSLQTILLWRTTRVFTSQSFDTFNVTGT